MKWLFESNRLKHLIGIAIVAALTFSMLWVLYGTITWQHFFIVLYVAVAVSFAMEFKDVHHYNGDHVPIRKWDWSAWDWLDCLAGLIGGIAATIIHLIIYLLTC